MWYIPFVLLTMQTAAPESQSEELKAIADGLKTEVAAMMEVRRDFRDPPANPTMATESQLDISVKVVGQGSPNRVFRIGKPIFTELVDDTGKSLIDNDTYTAADKQFTRLKRMQEKAGMAPLAMSTTVKASARGAKTIKTGRGTIKVVVAGKSIEVTIENPLQYRGKMIESQQLKDLGIEISVLPPGDPAAVPASELFMAVQYGKGMEKIEDVTFYDGWLQEIRSRTSAAKTNAGEDCVIMQVYGSKLDEDSQMVISVFPDSREVDVPINIDGFDLP